MANVDGDDVGVRRGLKDLDREVPNTANSNDNHRLARSQHPSGMPYGSVGGGPGVGQWRTELSAEITTIDKQLLTQVDELGQTSVVAKPWEHRRPVFAQAALVIALPATDAPNSSRTNDGITNIPAAHSLTKFDDLPRNFVSERER